MDYKLSLLLFLVFHGLFSQRDFRKDSMSLAENKIKVIQFINPQPDSALFYIKKSVKLAESINYDIGIADAEYLLAHYYRRTQKIDSAIIFFKQSALRSKKSRHTIGSSVANNGLCRVLYLLDRYEEAEKACNSALNSPKNETLDNELGYMTKADTHTALGTIYLRKNNIENAQENFLIVDSMHKDKHLRPDVIASAYQNLGGIHLDLNDIGLPENYFYRANDEFKKLPPKAAEYYLNANNVELDKPEFKKEESISNLSILTKHWKGNTNDVKV